MNTTADEKETTAPRPLTSDQGFWTTRAVGGLYEDEMVKVDGRWLYAKRVYRIIAEYQPKEA